MVLTVGLSPDATKRFSCGVAAARLATQANVLAVIPCVGPALRPVYLELGRAAQRDEHRLRAAVVAHSREVEQRVGEVQALRRHEPVLR